MFVFHVTEDAYLRSLLRNFALSLLLLMLLMATTWCSSGHSARHRFRIAIIDLRSQMTLANDPERFFESSHAPTLATLSHAVDILLLSTNLNFVVVPRNPTYLGS